MQRLCNRSGNRLWILATCFAVCSLTGLSQLEAQVLQPEQSPSSLSPAGDQLYNADGTPYDPDLGVPLQTQADYDAIMAELMAQKDAPTEAPVDPELERIFEPESLSQSEEVKSAEELLKDEIKLEEDEEVKAHKQELLESLTVIEPTVHYESGRFFSYTNARGYSSQDNIRIEIYHDFVGVMDSKPISVTNFNLESLNEVFFDLPNGKQLTLLMDKIDHRGQGQYSWIGHPQNQFGSAIFVVNNDMITGTVKLGTDQYQIKPLAKGVHVLLEVDATAFENEEDEATYEDMLSPKPALPYLGPNDDEQSSNFSGAAVVVDDCPIRLLAVYTDDVGSAHADPVSEIQLSVDYYNIANAYSQVNHTVELARVVEISYAETGNSSTDVNRLQNPSDGFLDAAHSQRALYDADMVIGVFVNTGGCGRAYGIGSSASTAFCVSDYGCMAGNLTFAHEFGHLYGARHDTYVDGTAGDDHGFVNWPSSGTQRWRTVMAYNDECDCSNEVSPCPVYASRATPGSPYCSREQFWSTDDETFMGVTIGSSTARNEDILDSKEFSIRGYEAANLNKHQYAADVIANDEQATQRGLATLTTDVGDPLTWNSGSRGWWKAKDEITFLEGFWARSGTDFEAVLEECISPASFEENEGPIVARKIFKPGIDEAGAQEFSVSPNPAKVGSSITVNYTVDKEEFTSLEVYSQDGRHIETIFYQPVHAIGMQTIKYASQRMPVGAYYFVLRSGEKSQTKAVIMH